MTEGHKSFSHFRKEVVRVYIFFSLFFASLLWPILYAYEGFSFSRVPVFLGALCVGSYTFMVYFADYPIRYRSRDLGCFYLFQGFCLVGTAVELNTVEPLFFLLIPCSLSFVTSSYSQERKKGFALFFISVALFFLFKQGKGAQEFNEIWNPSSLVFLTFGIFDLTPFK